MKPILLQIVGLVAWTATWIAEGALFVIYFRAQTYNVFRNLLIMDAVSFIMNLDIFLIVAFVLYKSSKAAVVNYHQQDPQTNQDVSVLAYMRD